MDLTKKLKMKQKFIPDYLTEMNEIMTKMNASLVKISENLEILRELEEKRKEAIEVITESANKTKKKQKGNADDKSSAKETGDNGEE